MNFDNFEIEQQIDNYLNNTMTATEKAEFETLLSNSPELQEQVELTKLIKVYHEHPEIPEVRNLIKNSMVEEEVIIKRLTIRRIMPIIALAASIVLAIIIIPYFTSSGDVFADNFSPVPDIEVVFEEEDLQLISGSEEKDLPKLVNDIEKALQNKQYDKALSTLQILFDDNWLKDELFIYRANALLGKGNTTEAIEIYEQLLENETELQSMTKWYLALAHIKNKDTKEATIILKDISSTNNDYQRKAKRLLKKL